MLPEVTDDRIAAARAELERIADGRRASADLRKRLNPSEPLDKEGVAFLEKIARAIKSRS
jgi:hypothetical protein